MAANYSHFSFGKAVFQQLDNPVIKKMIIDYFDLFLIGLHGPDILFYHYPLKPTEIKKYGHTMHDLQAYDFFLKNKTTNQEYLVYLYGFICHFALDSMCHHCVADCMKDTGRSHYQVEAQFDKYLMIKEDVDYMSTSTAFYIETNDEINKISSYINSR